MNSQIRGFQLRETQIDELLINNSSTKYGTYDANTKIKTITETLIYTPDNILINNINNIITRNIIYDKDNQTAVETINYTTDSTLINNIPINNIITRNIIYDKDNQTAVETINYTTDSTLINNIPINNIITRNIIYDKDNQIITDTIDYITNDIQNINNIKYILNNINDNIKTIINTSNYITNEYNTIHDIDCEFPNKIVASDWIQYMNISPQGFVPIIKSNEIQLTDIKFNNTCNKIYYDYPLQQNVLGFSILFKMYIKNNANSGLLKIFIGSSDILEMQGGYNIEFKIGADGYLYLKGPDNQICASSLDQSLFVNSSWISVKISYSPYNINQWMISFNNKIILSYSNSNSNSNTEWYTNGSLFGIAAITTTSSMTSSIKDLMIWQHGEHKISAKQPINPIKPPMKTLPTIK